MAEEQQEQRWARPEARGRSFLWTLGVALLLALVGWLLSERNAHRYSLIYEDGTLSVKKGIPFPFGSLPFKSQDPAEAAAYAPLKPPPGVKLEEQRDFDDRSGLDQALYDLLARWARDDVASGQADRVERALTWLGRADRLANISAAQRKDLETLRAESGVFEARQLLDRSAEQLRLARERLRLAAGSSSPRAGEASEALRRIEPIADEVFRAARVLGTPAEASAAAAAPSPLPAGPAAPAAGPPAARLPASAGNAALPPAVTPPAVTPPVPTPPAGGAR